MRLRFPTLAVRCGGRRKDGATGVQREPNSDSCSLFPIPWSLPSGADNHDLSGFDEGGSLFADP